MCSLNVLFINIAKEVRNLWLKAGNHKYKETDRLWSLILWGNPVICLIKKVELHSIFRISFTTWGWSKSFLEKYTQRYHIKELFHYFTVILLIYYHNQSGWANLDSKEI